MKSLPKISIVIPSYNKGEYIQETLESIVSQRYPNLEVIIQDGASTDETVGIVKGFAKKYPKIINWISKKDRGQVDAINRGLEKATGEIITYINADDVYKRGALLIVGKYFQENPETFWIAGRGKVIDSEGKEISRIVTFYKNILLTINYYPLLLIVNYLMQPSVFVSRSAYEKNGVFSGIGGVVMEYDLWLKLGKTEMPKVLNDHISDFRLMASNISSTQYMSVLRRDLEIAKKHTANQILLFLHRLHNLGRVLTVRIAKLV
ncbi:glycosyltransferase [Patescibacteria group bacterium]|nr:glycosyltransferase [Patescibacteria group bacterium]MBU0777364.1 glycosyltransferase [Patescibacteria group bacterium]MBU0845992.1 glycosyltransferase [Patescibacteria group bacterium]MBU0922540.1 glycosyltransferase [Patescibacteria group bacterium]MBU1066527.1 glycosyltransferase [Patescibacteria group bacterium]